MIERGKIFEGVFQWKIDLAGQEGLLPVFYYDNSALNVMMTASSRAVRRLLPSDAMHLAEVRPGRCLVVFSAFEYRKTDIGAYNELSIAFPIILKKPRLFGIDVAKQVLTKRFGAFVWKLPVTTEIARRGGVDYYGFPKFLASIEFGDRAGSRECTLREGGKTILTLRGERLRVRRGPMLRATTYSVMEGTTIRATACIDALEFGQSVRPGAAEVTLGHDHPIADTLRELRLGVHPILYQYAPLTEAILFGGRNLLDV